VILKICAIHFLEILATNLYKGTTDGFEDCSCHEKSGEKSNAILCNLCQTYPQEMEVGYGIWYRNILGYRNKHVKWGYSGTEATIWYVGPAEKNLLYIHELSGWKRHVSRLQNQGSWTVRELCYPFFLEMQIIIIHELGILFFVTTSNVFLMELPFHHCLEEHSHLWHLCWIRYPVYKAICIPTMWGPPVMFVGL